MNNTKTCTQVWLDRQESIEANVMIAQGPRRLKKIVLSILAFGMCVNVMLLIASTYNKRRIETSTVCECPLRTVEKLENKAIESPVHDYSTQIEKERAENIVNKHMERKVDDITAKSTHYLNTTLAGNINPGRPISSHGTVKATALKSDAVIVETNKTFPNARPPPEVLKTSFAPSTVEMLSMRLKHTQTVTSPIIEKIPQRIPSSSRTGELPQPSSQEVSVSTLEHKKMPAEERPQSQLVEKPLTLPLDSTKVPSTPPITTSRKPSSPSNTVKHSTPLSKIVSDRQQVNDEASPSNKSTPQSITVPVQKAHEKIPVTSKTQPDNPMNQSEKGPKSIPGFAWKTITDTVSIFSAYYDTRYLVTKPYGIYQNSLVIFGYEKSQLTSDVFCVVITDDNKKNLVEKPAVRIVLAELWLKSTTKYRAVMYRCNLTIPGNLQYATLYDATVYKDFNSIPQAVFVPVVDNHFPMEHKFGVCYETPLYGNKYDQEIMDSIEMNRLLGATWFTIYVFEAHDKALEIMRYYTEELKILDAILNWGHNMPSPAYNRGLLAGVHDCVYRNMFRVRYLVLCDLDEVITPQKGIDWHTMMEELDKPEIVYFSFRHLGFHKNHSKPTEFLPCPGRPNLTYKMPSFFAVHNRSVDVITKNRQVKSIAKPRYSIAVHVHYSRWIMPGYIRHFVSTDLAVLKHYRDKDDPRYLNYNSTLDYSMDRFKTPVLGEIEKHYCKNIKHVPS